MNADRVEDRKMAVTLAVAAQGLVGPDALEPHLANLPPLRVRVYHSFLSCSPQKNTLPQHAANGDINVIHHTTTTATFHAPAAASLS